MCQVLLKAGDPGDNCFGQLLWEVGGHKEKEQEGKEVERKSTACWHQPMRWNERKSQTFQMPYSIHAWERQSSFMAWKTIPRIWVYSHIFLHLSLPLEKIAYVPLQKDKTSQLLPRSVTRKVPVQYLDLTLDPEVERFIPDWIFAILDGFSLKFFIWSSWQPKAHVAISMAHCMLKTQTRLQREFALEERMNWTIWSFVFKERHHDTYWHICST